MESVKKIFGDNMRAYREHQKKSQDDLARALHTDKGMISRYESGEVQLKIEKMVLIADELGASLDWLCGREEAHPRTKGGERVENDEILEKKVAVLEEELVLLQASLLGLARIVSRRTGSLGPELLTEHRNYLDGLTARLQQGQHEDKVVKRQALWEEFLNQP